MGASIIWRPVLYASESVTSADEEMVRVTLSLPLTLIAGIAKELTRAMFIDVYRSQ